MEAKRGKRIAILVAASTLVALGLFAFVFRGRIQEEYWIWRLKAGNERERTSAAEYLGKHGPPEVFGLLLENTARELERHPEAWEYMDETTAKELDSANAKYLEGSRRFLKWPLPETLGAAIQAEMDIYNRSYNRQRAAVISVLWKLTIDPRVYVRAQAVKYLGGAYWELPDPPVSRIELIRDHDPEELVRIAAKQTLMMFENSLKSRAGGTQQPPSSQN